MTGDEAGRRLELVSWNVHGLPAPFSRDRHGRLGRIAAELARRGPDVALLQEA